MDSALVHLVTFFIKLALMFYIIVSIWYPVRAINCLLDQLWFKAIVLASIVVCAMLDVPLAILLAACLVVAIVNNDTVGCNGGSKAAKAAAKAHAQAPAQAVLDSIIKPQPQQSPPSAPKSGGDLRIYDAHKTSGIPLAQPKEDAPNVKYASPSSVELEAIDMEIIKLSHVSEERLAAVQTSAIEQGLMGYEEDNVATVDMETVLLVGH